MFKKQIIKLYSTNNKTNLEQCTNVSPLITLSNFSKSWSFYRQWFQYNISVVSRGMKSYDMFHRVSSNSELLTVMDNPLNHEQIYTRILFQDCVLYLSNFMSNLLNSTPWSKFPVPSNLFRRLKNLLCTLLTELIW